MTATESGSSEIGPCRNLPAMDAYDMHTRQRRKRRPTGVTVPVGVGPHVKLVFTEMRRQNVTYDEVEEGSGVRRAALKAWRHRNVPTLTSAEAVLNYLGWGFVPIPKARAVPPEIIDELRPLAERLGLAMPEALRLTTEIAYRDHHATGREPT